MDPDVARAAFAHASRGGWPRAVAHPKLQSGSRLAGGGQLCRLLGRPGRGSDARGVADPLGAGIDLFIGPNGSGLPLHHHGAVWNGLRWGRKLWALLPPARASFAPAKQHPLDSEWLQAWRRRGHAGGGPGGGAGGAAAEEGARFCVQEAGDVLYVPPHWAHATLNLEEGLSVGGFLQDDLALSLHMQLAAAPRGIGSLQNAALLHEEWYRSVARAFPVA